MGIQGLIPFLDKVSSRINISQYKGYCVAIDAYCWLHKGAYTCAEKLSKGQKCDAYVYYCMKYVNMLLSHNIKPILVFDGRHLPAKAGTEKKRRESREINRKTAAELLSAGRVEEARNYLRRCVDVTHEMALALIKECRKNNVDCIVAPYEADAQLAYLNLQNIAQVVITEDSDLILFGCSKIVFKLDLQGYGLLVEHERLHLSMGMRAENFSFDGFRYMCILSGCDYLPSLPGIGLSKALKFIKKTRDPDIHRALRRMPSYLNMTQLKVSDEYRDGFMAADATFRYQPVFDPRTRRLVTLTEPPEGEVPPDIVNEQLSPDVAFNLALGNLDPFTLTRVDNFDPDCPQQGVASLQRRSWGSSVASAHPSIWSRDFSGFEPAPRDKRFPSSLNCSAIVDVTPLRVPKQPLDITLDQNPSQSDLMSMYKSKEPEFPEPKRLCSSPRDGTTDESPNKQTATDSSHHETSFIPHENQQEPLSPILSQPKTRNPFAKPKQNKSSGLGPHSAMGQPNYFSALRKFDGIYPMNIDTDVITVSRYFRSSGVLEGKQSTNPVRRTAMKDMSNADLPSSVDNALPDEKIMLAGYSCDQENKCEMKSPQQSSSLLAELDAIQNEEIRQHVKSNSGHEEERKDNEGDRKLHVSEDNDIHLQDVSAKSPMSSFNWSQFTCKKTASYCKLKSSQSVNRMFKNPFKKKTVLKSDFCEGKIKETEERVYSALCFAPSPIKKSAQNNLEMQDSSVCSEKSSCSANLSDEDVFQSSADEPVLGSQANSSFSSSPLPALGSAGGDDTCMRAEAMGIELGPSEDSLRLLQQQCVTESEDEEKQQQQLSGESVDSGYQESQDTSPKSRVKNMMGQKNPYSTSSSFGRSPRGRRLGLSHSTASNPAPQKQNFLAQYGFSKKRKLAS